MNILIINLILHTHEKGVIPRKQNNHDCMIFNMARGYVINGHNVTLAASADYEAAEADNEDFSTVYFKSILPAVFRPSVLPFPKGLAKFINQNNFDLIITTEVFSIGSLIAARAAKCPVVVWQELAIHQRMMHHLPSKLWYNVIAKSFMRRALVIPQSEKARNFIKAYMPRVSDTIVDHGCNSSVFYPDTQDVSEDSFVIISRLVPGKQPLLMLERFLDLLHHEGREHFVLHVIGDGPERATMERKVMEAGAQNNVIFHGFLNHADLATVSRRTKAMLILTKMDLNPVSVSESIANGTPVLMNSIPYTAGFVKEHRLGLVSDNWGASELEQMIEHYAEFHAGCIAQRDNLTETGCAAHIVDIAKHFFCNPTGSDQAIGYTR